MSLFKFKLTPLTVESNWMYKPLLSSRVKKKCYMCGQDIPADMYNSSFTQKVSIGDSNKYNVMYTCGHSVHPCTSAMLDFLKIRK